jgi:uroporphyrinogen decarboxylase
VTASAEKLLIRTLKGEATECPPVWLMRQAGRYLPEYRKIRADVGSFLDLCYTPELAAEVTLQPIRRFGFDAAILFSDILVIPDGLGQKVAFQTGEGPVLDALKSADDVARLDRSRATEHLAPVLETVRLLRRDLPEHVALIGFAGAPWTVATYMIEGGSSRDFATVKAMAYGEPTLFAPLIDTLVEATADYLVAQIDAGAEAVQLFDSWAGALPDKAFARWVLEPTTRIVERIRATHPDVPIIGFPRGAGVMYLGYAATTGVDAVSLDTSVPVDWAAHEVQTIAAVQGNLDPILLRTGGDALNMAIRHIRRGFSGGPFVFNLGHGIVPDTPPDHVAQLVAVLRENASASAA